MKDYFEKLTHPNAPWDDLRTLWAVARVPRPADGAPVNLGECQTRLGVAIDHPLFGAGSVQLERHLPGVQYHPLRKKWIVLYESPSLGQLPHIESSQTLLQKSQVETSQGLIRMLTHPDGTNPGFTLQFDPGTFEFINVRDMLSEGLLSIRRGSHEESGNYAPAAPVEPDYWDLIDPSSLTAMPLVGGQTKVVVPLWGGVELEVTYEEGSEHPLGRGLMEIWPSVASPDWKLTWVACLFRGAPAGSLAVPLIEDPFSEDRWAFRPPTADEALSAREIAINLDESDKRLLCRARVRAIGVKTKAASGIFLCSNVPTSSLARPAGTPKQARIAIDFGTSRSCVVVSRTDEYAKLAGFAARSAFPGDSAGDKEQGNLWLSLVPPIPTLPAYYDDRTPPGEDGTGNGAPAFLTLESQLLRRKKSNADRPLPFIHYSILPNGVERARLSEYDIPERQRLKWHESAHRERVEYLTALLCIAMSEAASRFGTLEAKIGYSFPLAFDEVQKEELTGCLEEAAGTLKEWSGADLTLDRPVSESLSGLSALAEDARGWVLTVDIGGGTTDFGLWTRDTDTRRLRALGADSLEFAGDLLLPAAGKVATTIPRAQEAIHKGEFLSRELRRAKSERMENYQDYISTVGQWRGLLVEYAARLIAGTVIREGTDGRLDGIEEIPVQVISLGGGWNALDSLTSAQNDRSFSSDTAVQGEITKDLTDRVAALLANEAKAGLAYPRVRLGSLGVGILREGREKLAIAQGIFQAVSQYGEPLGISSPNGLDERAPGGTTIPWHRSAGIGEHGKREFAKDTDVLPVPPIPLAGELLQDLSRADTTLSNELRHQINRVTQLQGGGARRHRTALSLLYKSVLGPHVESP